MIITEQKAFQEILDNLEKKDKVILVGCGVCATTAETGGKDQVDALKQRLEEKKVKVLLTEVIEPSCDERKVRIFLNKNKDVIKKAGMIIIMSCGAGVQAFKQLDAGLDLIPALNTVFLATEKRLGEFYQFCSLCGNCILHLTSGVCAVTRCPKGYANGPCGGAKNGKCEAEPDNDCVWHIISKTGINTRIKDCILQNRDYSKQFHPKKKIKIKEG